jgi:hypothetical protein
VDGLQQKEDGEEFIIRLPFFQNLFNDEVAGTATCGSIAFIYEGASPAIAVLSQEAYFWP